MLLLYRGRDGSIHCIIVPLHSTMLLLYLLAEAHQAIIVNLLYIPLCFYYIESSAALWPMQLHSLHSTMLLLYPDAYSDTPQGGITFTFHYASTISDNFPNFMKYIVYLYIPLCFYYIGIYSKRPWAFTHFTFHYASTISWSGHHLCGSLHTLYIPLCFYYIPLLFSPFYFLQYRYTFCLPPFLIDFFSKIIHLSLYKV